MIEQPLDRRRKNQLTFWHQIATLALLPILGWIALQFVDMRDGVRKSMEAMARIEDTLPKAWARINDHETRIRIMEARSHERWPQ